MEGELLHLDSQLNKEQGIHKYSNMVYRVAFARVGNIYDSDEVYQEVFLRYIRRKLKFRDNEHEKAWLLKVTINCCNNILTHSWNKKTVELSKEIPFESKEDINLYQELQKLSPDYRIVIHLFYYEDLTTIEIAKLLNRKHSTVRTQLTRARQLLRGIIKEEDYV